MVLSPEDEVPWDTFLRKNIQVCDAITVHEGEADIDYGSMCFTVLKKDGKARLSPCATYYTDLRSPINVDENEYTAINIELFED